MTIHTLSSHAPAFARIMGGVIHGSTEVHSFTTAEELKAVAKPGDALAVVSSPGLPDFPTPLYDTVRECGLVLWAINDAFARAAAGDHPDVPKAEPPPVEQPAAEARPNAHAAESNDE